MENTQEPQEREELQELCQRCQVRNATHHTNWPEDRLTTLPEGASSEDYLPAYEHLCDTCFEAVFRPTPVESLDDIARLIEKWESAKQLVDG